MKKLTLALAALLCTLGLAAQQFTGGVKGTVVSRSDRTPVAGAALELYQGTELVATVTADETGQFLIPDLDNGIYDLVIRAQDFLHLNDGFFFDEHSPQNRLFGFDILWGHPFW